MILRFAGKTLELLRTSPEGVRLQTEAKAAATYDEKKASALFARLARNGTWICPTIAVARHTSWLPDEENKFSRDSRVRYIPATLGERWRREFKQRAAVIPSFEDKKRLYQMRFKITGAMKRAGVQILAGTDAPNPYVFPGFSLHEELELLVQAGLSPFEALQTATVNPAKFFGRENAFGTIEKGKLADLILLEASPLEDIKNTTKIAAVVAGGKYLPKSELEKLLARAETFAKK